ncbi:hypothetical protein PSV08DRAFT_408869 [Bipolaris maydis]|uniref:uncharacterized protein n=1 Tax=Cochliobolus heterostrophus TaxID=5016 RepID=UPI0024D05004|nr:hypothetical protein PSV08DRAFT_408869 [Bipolaris maydis]KAJ6281903.1 hypothetical protein J3E71DRAFT_391959 [Bipolaris maydis]
MCPLQADDNYGGERYPQNLGLASLDSDASRHDARLSQLSKQLFVANDDSTFEFTAIGVPHDDGGHKVLTEQIGSTKSLNAVLGLGSTTSLVFIDQSYTWSRLCISEEHFRQLFTRMAVHPDFLHVVRLFCEKTGPVEEGFSSLFMHMSERHDFSHDSISGRDCSYYVGYNIKYVAKHGRRYPSDPFSIREVGVYQHFSSSDQQCRWVFLQAPNHLKDRLRHNLECLDNRSPTSQVLQHSMLLVQLSEDWREYLMYLEDEFSKIVDRGFFTNVKELHDEGDVQADFSDLRKLHILTDKLLRLAHILKMNIRLGRQLKGGISDLKTMSSPSLQIGLGEMQARLDGYVYGQEMSLARIETLIARSGGIGQLVQGIQDFRSNEASKHINHEMQRLTEQGIKENGFIKRLTEQSTKDTRSMMAIALISAIFLPATFLATLFGSNFLVYSERENALTVASNLWVYVIMTCAFSGSAVMLWVIWRRRAMRGSTSDPIDVA